MNSGSGVSSQTSNIGIAEREQLLGIRTRLRSRGTCLAQTLLLNGALPLQLLNGAEVWRLSTRHVEVVPHVKRQGLRLFTLPTLIF